MAKYDVARFANYYDSLHFNDLDTIEGAVPGLIRWLNRYCEGKYVVHTDFEGDALLYNDIVYSIEFSDERAESLFLLRWRHAIQKTK